jgi:endonuclease/exonuclease/phosphatase (EEP) superfamily protein YafD
MTTFLFWNLNRKPLEKALSNLAGEHEVDVLMLAECAIPPATMLNVLNRGETAAFHFCSSPQHKLAIYARFNRRRLEAVAERRYYTIRRLKLPDRPEIILVATHFPSKRNWNEGSQAAECRELSAEIRRAEESSGHARTILVGDLNMNPFESGMVAANGLNAVMTRALALRRTRMVQARRYPFFYNPMWGYFGDVTGSPAGTYYYERAEQTIYFWNIFDQVLLRPDLLPYFRSEDLQILTGDGRSSFLSAKGLPDNSIASDHLPVLFKLHLVERSEYGSASS